MKNLENVSLYRILSALLSYPEQELIEALPEICSALKPWPGEAAVLDPLIDYLAATPLIEVQENYVNTFDRSPLQALHLFEHIHGESRDRGQAMVDLLEEYKQHGFEPALSELPDHVPLFLEYLSLIAAQDASATLGEAIHVLAAIGRRLGKNESPYTGIFAVLCTLTDVVPLEQTDPPVRSMDEVMEMYGPGADGVEPLLTASACGTHTISFHPRNKVNQGVAA
ncbi:MAG TPA: nitrate reductase molybdenum cofactor assembly chaperone [Rhodocyclaceae bacterium]|nr:nitrate reductase molybdenum cofactor assembly chaperone [Rhodocyclaceae bacterium]